MKKAVIFDLDGVLVHTDRLHYTAWKELTGRLGIPFGQTVYRRLRGISRMDSLDIVLEAAPQDFSPEEKAALAAEKNEAYLALAAGLGPRDVAEDVRRALRGLRERGLLLAVGSSSRNAKYILERTGLAPCFDAVADGTMVTRAKPDPEVFLKAAALLGVSPGQALVVEDAAAGIKAARDGGYTAVAFGGDAVGSPLAEHRVGALTELLYLV